MSRRRPTREDIHTPLLILHSEDDLRCPVEQAEHLFVTLRLLKRPVELVRFPAESHELTRSGSPVHRVQRFELVSSGSTATSRAEARRSRRCWPSPCWRGPASARCALGPRRPAAGAAAARPPARWVRVSVATLWVRPDEARSVDAPACAVPADPRAWVARLTVAQKRWLVGRLETQALYGAKVYLLGTSGAWSHVVVAGQPTPQARAAATRAGCPRGSSRAPSRRRRTEVAVVRRPTAWLYKTAALDGRVLELSYGTRLPVLSADGRGGRGRAAGGRLRLPAPRRPSPCTRRARRGRRSSGARLVAEARRFLGLQYLWAGTSGFGLDCSGFTHLVYRPSA